MALMRTPPGPERLKLCLIGQAGETGEVVEALLVAQGRVSEPLKKHLFRGKELPDLRLELGDVLYYLTALAGELGFSLEGIMEANIEKLEARAASASGGGH